jgi:hypothetical protein
LSNKAAHEIGGLFLAREFSAELKKPNNATLVRNVLQDALKALEKRTSPTS